MCNKSPNLVTIGPLSSTLNRQKGLTIFREVPTQTFCLFGPLKSLSPVEYNKTLKWATQLTLNLPNCSSRVVLMSIVLVPISLTLVLPPICSKSTLANRWLRLATKRNTYGVHLPISSVLIQSFVVRTFGKLQRKGFRMSQRPKLHYLLLLPSASTFFCTINNRRLSLSLSLAPTLSWILSKKTRSQIASVWPDDKKCFHLTICDNEHLSNSLIYCQSRFQINPNTKKTLKILPGSFKFSLSGEIWTNLVTLNIISICRKRRTTTLCTNAIDHLGLIENAKHRPFPISFYLFTSFQIS